MKIAQYIVLGALLGTMSHQDVVQAIEIDKKAAPVPEVPKTTAPTAKPVAIDPKKAAEIAALKGGVAKAEAGAATAAAADKEKNAGAQPDEDELEKIQAAEAARLAKEAAERAARKAAQKKVDKAAAEKAIADREVRIEAERVRVAAWKKRQLYGKPTKEDNLSADEVMFTRN